MHGLITEEYRKLNTELHRTMPTYGNGAFRWAPTVFFMAKLFGVQSVLDYGAGKGTLKRALAGSTLDIREYDPAIPAMAAAPEPADLVCCLDVLEHVEPQCIDSVIAHLGSLTRKVLLVDISCRVGDKKLPDGRFAHVLVRQPQWWIQTLGRIGEVRWLPCPHDEFAAYIQKD